MITWVIQENIFNERSYEDFQYNVHKTGDNVINVTVIPFSNDIEPKVDTQDIIIPYGSTKLIKIAKKLNLSGVFFNKINFDFIEYKKYYGKHLLNYDADIVPFKDLHKFEGIRFYRPTEDLKFFNGKVMDSSEILEFQEIIRSHWHDNENIEEIPCMVSNLKDIYNEYRYFIVDGQITTFSLYRLGGKVVYSNLNRDGIIDNFVKERISEWTPERAFVLDVATTDVGIKIIEVNCINSAGLYACDTFKLVNGLRELVLKRACIP